MAEHLCHVTTPGALAAGMLTATPFLHCCTEAQLGFVLARHFAGRSGLVVLRFDPAAVSGEVVWEHSEPGQGAFPHLYGTLPMSVTAAAPAPGDWG